MTAGSGPSTGSRGPGESPTERRELWTKLAHLTGWDEGNDDDEGD